MKSITEYPKGVEVVRDPEKPLSKDETAREEDIRSIPETDSSNAGDRADDDGISYLSRITTAPRPNASVIGKTLSLVRTKDSGRDPGPPPDGGAQAWIQAWLSHLVIFNTWGYINGFGVFQTYYTETLARQPSDISWIGSIQIFLLFFIGTFSGRATDAGYFKAVWSVGAVIIILAIFMTSLCHTYWQIFLVQGVLLGLGSGLVFCPTVALLPTYFSSNRAVALAIGASGSATGGLVFPVVIRQLLPKIGFAWTMRVLGLITLLTLAPGFLFLRQRIPPRRSGPFFEWAAFREPAYALYAVGMFLNFWALYVAFFYISSFGKDVIGLPQSSAIDLLLVMNGVGVVGRLLPSFISDWKLGPFNSLIPCLFVSGVMLFGWMGVKDIQSLWIFTILYGFFAAGVQSLFPAAVTSLTTDLKKTGIRFGMILSIVSFSSLTGSPIAGALIQLKGGDYLYAQLFAGLSMSVGVSIIIASRHSLVGSKIQVRV
ncbi:hypothetical protein FQN57_002218 [Myotisia sp. PD_48]|nr:hypothetical protein FQN57_002218 [Myotisia sp. PD_48]